MKKTRDILSWVLFFLNSFLREMQFFKNQSMIVVDFSKEGCKSDSFDILFVL